MKEPQGGAHILVRHLDSVTALGLLDVELFALFLCATLCINKICHLLNGEVVVSLRVLGLPGTKYLGHKSSANIHDAVMKMCDRFCLKRDRTD